MSKATKPDFRRPFRDIVTAAGEEAATTMDLAAEGTSDGSATSDELDEWADDCWRSHGGPSLERAEEVQGKEANWDTLEAPFKREFVRTMKERLKLLDKRIGELKKENRPVSSSKTPVQ